MLCLIAAMARNRAIGRNGQLLWRCAEDLRHFRQTTSGKAVIMGRKTWESLPPAFRPLPERRNIVVSRNTGYQAAGALVAHSLDQAITLADSDADVFVIGGGDLYGQALPLAGRCYLTELAAEYPGDTFFPELPANEWRQVSRVAGKAPSATGDPAGAEPAFDFVVYERI
ncbi:MAG TPA: dihydrofolate reductase [Accumulibacter sp.]|uniref:dihydrofolate reductase n=1 Tax=Accumulibacter sp. TaxID=2053492 RepID=UPI002D12D7F3|nr:dihydrofolate reductase [Accumulibacter sp.]HMV05413.1 dihydrofolate reductase [Accumulibacter sp.]HMW79759.1 dihydrofolate reductase [Accumulibacter sp.]HNC25322.1 dihydrofolate reductase [Accumulibacter sp.]HND37374.1 dihydrofolate reductase [Accumulibacter sp.]HNE38405.1 dihydrofolate reductase [Accumulibacter sp.]